MNKNKLQGMFMGLAVGDALGMPVEFKTRGHFEEIKGYRSGGPFDLPAGYWTDDTSMALCLADSILEKGGYDSFDVMDRYVRWIKNGYRSSTGKCFDVGNQVNKAISDFVRNPIVTISEKYVEAAGNGCIMRLAPVVVASIASGKNMYATERYSMVSARETHLSYTAEQATGLFGSLLYIAATKTDAKNKIHDTIERLAKKSAPKDWMHNLTNISQIKIDDVKPTGYVVDTLIAALWAFMTTNNFQDAVLKSVNLGGDSDTIGAVCGQLAGAYYGLGGIPKDWIDQLHDGNNLLAIVERLINTKNFSFLKSRFEIDKSGPGYSDERAEEFEKMPDLV